MVLQLYTYNIYTSLCLGIVFRAVIIPDGGGLCGSIALRSIVQDEVDEKGLTYRARVRLPDGARYVCTASAQLSSCLFVFSIVVVIFTKR